MPEESTTRGAGRSRIPWPAQYLLRLDDLCPTVSREHWERFPPLIARFGIKPILAVIPDNQDLKLMQSTPDPEFWAQMRELEAAGATIALHGYQHLCESRGRSVLGLHRRSEFAGVSEEMQQARIRAGLEILRGYGLTPKLWVAPRHGFDETTLRVLRNEGIEILSDGFARAPFVRGEMIWIPQQLWAPVIKRRGLWTICIHPNSFGQSQFTRLEFFLAAHAVQFTSVDRVLAELEPGTLCGYERMHEKLALWKARSSWVKRRILGRYR